MEIERNKPIHKIKIGCVQAAVWSNQGPNGPWFSTTFSRIYRDGEEWKQSGNFNRDDLLVVAKLADQAHSWIVENQKKEPTE